MSPDEIWKQVPEFPYLEASNLGRIVRRDVLPNVVLKQYLNKQIGYYLVTLNIDTPHGRKQTHRYVHRLVLSAFEGIPPGKAEVNHIDGDKTNNLLSNLEWTTRAGNAKHAWETGLIAPRTSALMTNIDDVLQMRRDGKTYAEIDKHFRVPKGSTNQLMNNTIDIDKPDRLAERRKQVVELRDNHGLTFNEIAAQIGVSFWQAYNLYRYSRG